MFDLSLKEGESIYSSNGKASLTYKGDGYTVETPAGMFENCALWVTDGASANFPCAETYFCPGVGIVKQTASWGHRKYCHLLASYDIKGGEGWFPAAKGNTWSYIPEDPDCHGVRVNFKNRYEMTHAEGDSIVLYQAYTEEFVEYEESWMGYMRKARLEYCNDDGLVSIGDAHERAAELASTKREKLHTAIATDVMKLADTVPEAMRKMAAKREILEKLPGLDCGTCGAPSCAALADDIVRGFASEKDCVFMLRDQLSGIDRELIPAPYRAKEKE
jgi:ArsR family metal-binding transcriptional regulator